MILGKFDSKGPHVQPYDKPMFTIFSMGKMPVCTNKILSIDKTHEVSYCIINQITHITDDGSATKSDLCLNYFKQVVSHTDNTLPYLIAGTNSCLQLQFLGPYIVDASSILNPSYLPIY